MTQCCIAEVAEGEFIGDYQVLDVLGRGPMGTTYHVVSNVLQKEFALKTLKIGEHILPEWLDRLEAQTAVLQRLAHPHIDTIVGSGRFEDMWLCVKDFVHDGEGFSSDLSLFLQRHDNSLSHYQVCHIAEQLLEALAYAHDYSDQNHTALCHGNLKPQNVLLAYSALASEGVPFEVKLTDFQPYGLMSDELVVSTFRKWQEMATNHPSLVADKAIAHHLSSLFAPYDYMAPEKGTKPTPQSDIYSFGALLYQMLTGNVPGSFFLPPSEVNPQIPAAWDDIVTKCLQRKACVRYRSAKELLEEIRTRFDDILCSVETASPMESKERHSITPRGMVYIPAGTFLVGREECGNDALPQHECTTSGFYIDRTPVTNLQFSHFVLDTGYITEAEKGDGAPLWIDGEWKVMDGISWRNPFGRNLPEDFDRHPVAQVTYKDATAYAKWLGRRLPTEQEWEYAALGGLREARFPWGDNSSNVHAHINSDSPVAVMKHHANGYGLYDMAGNVWEWTDSWYQPYPGNEAVNPHFGEKYRVVRGGCWMYDISHCIISYRNANQPGFAYPTVGFRTAKSI